LIIVSTIIGAKRLNNLSSNIIYVFSVLFIALHIILNVFASWNFGFRTADWTLKSNTFENEPVFYSAEKHHGLSDIAKLLKSRLRNGQSCNILIDRDRVDNKSVKLKRPALLLPCRTELVDSILWPVRGRPIPFQRIDSTKNYICYSKADYLLLPAKNPMRFIGEFIKNEKYGSTLIYENKRWKLYNIEYYKNNCLEMLL